MTSEPYWLNRLRWTWRHLLCALVGHDWITVEHPLPSRPAADLVEPPLGINDLGVAAQLALPSIPNERPLVHALFGGLPLCGFSNLAPADWPPGHLWRDPLPVADPPLAFGVARYALVDQHDRATSTVTAVRARLCDRCVAIGRRG